MKFSLVVPCYNEQQSLKAFSKEVFMILESIQEQYKKDMVFECIFINDGSKDNTISLLQALANKQADIKSHNQPIFNTKLPPPPIYTISRFTQ